MFLNTFSEVSMLLDLQ